MRLFEQGGEGNSSVDPCIHSLFGYDFDLVGVESVLNELVRNLVDGPRELIVISLVSEFGISKTSLAKKVYNVVLKK